MNQECRLVFQKWWDLSLPVEKILHTSDETFRKQKGLTIGIPNPHKLNIGFSLITVTEGGTCIFRRRGRGMNQCQGSWTWIYKGSPAGSAEGKKKKKSCWVSYSEAEKALRPGYLAMCAQQALPLGMTKQHKVPEPGHWACSKSVLACPWCSLLQGQHCVSTIVCFAQTRIEGSEVSHWPDCFLSSWGMFTEVWCFSKPLIRSTPCPLCLYFSKCVERTHCFCSLASIPKHSCRCEFHGILWRWTVWAELRAAILCSGFPNKKNLTL